MDNKGCRIVTIKEIFSLFKGEEQANAIELVSLEEVGNSIVAQKGLYKSGDKALFIEPDYCLSDVELFKEYICPQGDPKKCRLGSKNRVRAIKFNLHTGNNNPVYSYGVLVTSAQVEEFTKKKISDDSIDWDKLLEIVKWEEPETFSTGGKSVTSEFPQGMYQTDEDNINNIINDINFPTFFIGTEKVDGSSITIWYKNGKSGIASRKQGRPLTYNKIVGYRKPTFLHKLLTKWTKGKYRFDGKIIKLSESDDVFVTVGKPYLENLIKYCKENGCNLALRGELVGKGCKGSGNPNNPKAKEERHIEFFGIDDYSTNTAKIEDEKMRIIAEKMGLQLVKECFRKTFETKEEIFDTCQKIFDEEKENGRIIEGIVLKSLTCRFSVKLMNLEYDSRK